MKTYEFKNGYSVDVFNFMLFVNRKDDDKVKRVKMVRYNTFDNAMQILNLIKLNKGIDK